MWQQSFSTQADTAHCFLSSLLRYSGFVYLHFPETMQSTEAAAAADFHFISAAMII